MRASGSSDPDRRAAPRTDASRRSHHDVVYTLARAAEVHDPDTGDHLLRMHAVVERLAVVLGWPEEEADALGYDAMLHDVGKLFIPSEILRKPDGLSPHERSLMESHTIHGERLLRGRPSLARAASIARSHHEAWDGSGYPDGLVGDAIPLEARIVAVADCIDALVAHRAYKAGWSLGDAVAEVRRQRGIKLDAQIVDALDGAEGDPSFRALLARRESA
jgi:putative two-component system response regulator